MKVLLLSRYENLGASSRVRLFQYIPYLNKEGIKVNIAPLFSDEYIRSLYKNGFKPLGFVVQAYIRRLISLTKIKRYDLLWIEKELFPMLPAWGEELIAALKIPYIVDYDDAIFHNYDLNKNMNILIRTFLKNKIDSVMKNAAIVVVCNDYLAERALKAGAKKVEYLPSVVDLEKYKFSDKFSPDVFRIGWIGSPSTSKYLNLIYNVLIKFCSESNAHLILVGAGKIDLPGVPVEIREWREEKEVTDIQSFDVGIMPLPDEPWERGKCGYKLIQCMACGRPVIASNVGINNEIIRTGYNGFLASNEKGWEDAFKILRDPVVRKTMGKYARLTVEEKYSLQNTAQKYVDYIIQVAKSK